LARTASARSGGSKGTDAVGVVLAAGKGKRMRSDTPKAVIHVAGKPLARHAVDACLGAGMRRVLVVIGHGGDEVREAVGQDVQYVEQSEQLGTGHALASAEKALAAHRGTIVVVPGDAPLMTPPILRALLRTHRRCGTLATIMAAELDNPYGYGRLLYNDDGTLARIVEERDATPAQRRIRDANVGFYAFECPQIFRYLKKIRTDNKQKEYYLTDIAAVLRAAKQRVGVYRCPDAEHTYGINSPGEWSQAEAILRRRTMERMMARGVRIVDPESTYVDVTVEIGADTIIYPGCIIEGATRIAGGCRIGPWARLRNARVGKNASVIAAFVFESTIDPNVSVGPFAHLRDGARIRDGAQIGNFVEVKKSDIGAGVMAKHLTYVGDAQVGEMTNIGAGCITCNYDGMKKNRTVIGKRCFVGSNTTLIAPLTVEDESYVAAGSTINMRVPAESLAIARSRQINKPGWAAMRRRMRRRANAK
jgi:bifunctional UDP-N-acetylglucosamine pyrophosphorylase/glucosamine-1-phosphate N-acetyltransferase